MSEGWKTPIRTCFFVKVDQVNPLVLDVGAARAGVWDAGAIQRPLPSPSLLTPPHLVDTPEGAGVFPGAGRHLEREVLGRSVDLTCSDNPRTNLWRESFCILQIRWLFTMLERHFGNFLDVEVYESPIHVCVCACAPVSIVHVWIS